MADPDQSSQQTISAYFVFFSSLLALVLVLSKVHHDHPRLSTVLPEAGMILLVGMTAGCIVHLVWGDERIGEARGMEPQEQDDNDGNVDYQVLVDNVLSFSPNAFFVALLPPIIFNSGYHLQRELFFRHIQPIALLAVAGTLISAVVIAFTLKLIVSLGWAGNDFVPTLTELLTFGALISATDPVSTLAVFQAKRVDPQLFYLVFGESVLNDAVGLVLFETFCKFVQRDNGAGKIAMGFVEFIFGFLLDSVASPLLGWVSAILTALLFKYMDFRNNKLLELGIYLLIMYAPFLLAEVLGLSGIVTILVTGIAARHYVAPNLSESTQDVADVIFRLSAHLAETSIFLELGLSVFGVTEFLQWKFIGWSLLACLLARACNVYPVTAFFNQSLQTDTFSCPCVKSKWKEGLDGIMKMEFGQASVDEETTQAPTKQSTKPRKPMSGNLELTEHLNDFSGPPVQEEKGKKRSIHRSDSQNSANSTSSQPHQSEAPQLDDANIVRTPSDTPSEQSMTPIPKRDLKIQPNTAHMLWFSGLRGAVAYACVRSFPDTFQHQREFMSTTMMIVLATVFIMGGLTEFALNWWNIEMNVNEEQYLQSWPQRDQATPGYWTYFDKRFVSRFVIRDYDGSSDAVKGATVNPATSAPIPCKDVPNESGRNSIISSSRRDSSATSKSAGSDTKPRPPDVEMTESSHYDTLQDMGIEVTQRRKTSLFDYGLKSD